MRVLITGICGFVGSTLARGMREGWPAWEIVGLDNFGVAHFGGINLTPDKTTRPFDVPWLVLDSSLAEQSWGWKPQTPLESVWNEIAEHAEQKPQWLDLTVD